MHRSLVRTTLTIATGSILGAVARADVLVVDAAGGSDFTDLPDAVAAAAEGDTLLVKSGSYTAFQLVDKGLHVVADVDASVHVDGYISIEGLGAGKAVLLSGLEVVGSETLYLDESNWFWATPAVGASGCEGAVRVQDCDLTGGPGVYDLEYLGVDSWAGGGTAAAVVDSGDVAFTSCQLRGGAAANLPQGYLEPWYGARGGHGLYVSSSDVTLNRCIAQAGKGGGAASGGFGGNGVRLVSCELVPTHSVVRGGDGGMGWYFDGKCGPTPSTRLAVTLTRRC